MGSYENDIDWALLIDILAKEYGWTIDYIKSLDLAQIMSLVKTIKARYKKENNESDDDDSLDGLEALGKVITRPDGKKEIVI